MNLVTPSSGKDFPREFTSRIQERVLLNQQSHLQQQQLHQQQHTTTILDPNSGKVTTILSSPVNETGSKGSCVGGLKKPSYLNLACCVNGYSNLTTYDSKLRQNINKSREVSPIRPITHTLQYNREGGGNYLVVPVPLPVKFDSCGINTTSPSKMDTNHRSIMSKEKRLFTSKMMNSEDVVDDASMNIKNYHKSTKIITNNTSMATSVLDTPTKSFIQQRVERLYGPNALAQGFYTNKRISDGNGNISSNVLSEKYPENNIQSIINGHSIVDDNHYHDSNNLKQNDNEQISAAALPVLRHLRPEFRAQLPISPKRGPIQTSPRNDISSSYTTTTNITSSSKFNSTSINTMTVIKTANGCSTTTTSTNDIVKSNKYNDNNYSNADNNHVLLHSNNENNLNGVSSNNTNIYNSSRNNETQLLEKINNRNNQLSQTNGCDNTTKQQHQIIDETMNSINNLVINSNGGCSDFNNSTIIKDNKLLLNGDSVTQYPSDYDKNLALNGDQKNNSILIKNNDSNAKIKLVTESVEAAPVKTPASNAADQTTTTKTLTSDNAKCFDNYDMLSSAVEKDGNYFLIISNRERDRLLLEADKIEKELEIVSVSLCVCVFVYKCEFEF